MDRVLRSAMAVLAAAWVLVMARPVFGIIKVETPVSKLVQQSRTVAVGRVSGVDQQRRAVELDAVEAIRGDLGDVGKRFRVEVDGGEVAGLLEKVATGMPAVVFISRDRNDAILHIGDRWVQGRRASQPGAPSLWRVTQAYNGASSYPGRTTALANVVREIKAGGTGLQDWVSHEVCLGGVYKRADIGLAGATFILSHDLNGDGLPDVIAGSAEGVRVMMAHDKTYIDQSAQWGLGEARGMKAAAADLAGDAAVDLVIGSRIWVRTGDRFVAGAKLDLGDERQWVAMGAGDAGGDGRADVAVVLRNGRMITAENAGGAGAAWKVTAATLWSDSGEAMAAAFANDFGDDGRLHAIVVRADAIMRCAAGAEPSAADFARLTGVSLAACDFFGAPMQPLLVAAYDYDGLGRTDFLLVTQAGGAALANRGHGAFLINRFAPEQFRPGGRDIKLPKLPFEPALGRTLATPGRQVQMQPKRKRGNLLVLTEKGELWEMDNERRR